MAPEDISRITASLGDADENDLDVRARGSMSTSVLRSVALALLEAI
jgi:hypothetical protein